MNLVPTERTAIFIDGGNLYSASRNLQFDVDYRALLTFFQKKTTLIRAHYYAAMLESDDPEEHSPLKPLTDWLSYNGYTVITKVAREYMDREGKRRLKGTNTSVNLVVDAMMLADRIDHMVFFAGDVDLAYFVEAVKKMGVKITVVSSINTTPPMIADELRRNADEFVDLVDIRDNFTKVRKER